jgi:hypothetical protein
MGILDQEQVEKVSKYINQTFRCYHGIRVNFVNIEKSLTSNFSNLVVP